MLTCRLVSTSVSFGISLELFRVEGGIKESKGKKRVWLFCASGPETNKWMPMTSYFLVLWSYTYRVLSSSFLVQDVFSRRRLPRLAQWRYEQKQIFHTFLQSKLLSSHQVKINPSWRVVLVWAKSRSFLHNSAWLYKRLYIVILHSVFILFIRRYRYIHLLLIWHLPPRSLGVVGSRRNISSASGPVDICKEKG